MTGDVSREPLSRVESGAKPPGGSKMVLPPEPPHASLRLGRAAATGAASFLAGLSGSRSGNEDGGLWAVDTFPNFP